MAARLVAAPPAEGAKREVLAMGWAVLYIVAAITHVLASATWLGAMVFSFAVVQPRAKAHLGGGEAFEALMAALGACLRPWMLAAFAIVAGSGAALLACQWSRGLPGTWWVVLMAAKTALLLAALGVFWYVSWRLWPRRIFAVGAEIPAIQRQFRIEGALMIALVALAMAAGVLASALLRLP